MLSYERLRAGLPVNLPAPRPFHYYINWLQRQDPAKSERFWRDYLQGFSAPTPLAIVHAADGAQSASDEIERELSPAISQGVMKLAREHGLTLAVIVQAAWAILLSRYSREQDVVLGSTFSGRSAPLDGTRRNRRQPDQHAACAPAG